MENTRQYTSTELKQLHTVLYEILEEVVRVCNQLEIPFFMIGGSAIGVYYWNGIIPFDDDIDIGMTRSNYKRFLKEAPKILDDKYFLQCYDTEPHMPYYFAKVRKNGTRYVEHSTKDMRIHQGIFVDIIPFDKIPNYKFLEQIQYKLANFVCEMISYRENPAQSNIHPKIDKIVSKFIHKNILIKCLTLIQTFFNRCNTKYYNNVMIRADHIPVEDLMLLQPAKFGGVDVFVPNHLERYLHFHYPSLKKVLTDEEKKKYSHAPLELSL